MRESGENLCPLRFPGRRSRRQAPAARVQHYFTVFHMAQIPSRISTTAVILFSR